MRPLEKMNRRCLMHVPPGLNGIRSRLSCRRVTGISTIARLTQAMDDELGGNPCLEMRFPSNELVFGKTPETGITVNMFPLKKTIDQRVQNRCWPDSGIKGHGPFFEVPSNRLPMTMSGVPFCSRALARACVLIHRCRPRREQDDVARAA